MYPPHPTTQTATGEKNGHIGMATSLGGACKQRKMQEGWEEKPFDQIQACLSGSLVTFEGPVEEWQL